MRKAIEARVNGHLTIVLYVLATIAAIVGIDIAFFKDRFWERLLANIGIMLLFGVVFYLRFLRL
jgi:hypothetical protein